MAVTHFIPSIWSKKILDDLETKVKLANYTNRDYEGDIKYAGRVKVLGVGEPTISNYSSSTPLVYESLSDKGQWLTITEQKSFSFEVDDIDEVQSIPGLPGKFQSKAAHKLAVARDNFVAGLMKHASGLSQNTVDATDGTITEYKVEKTDATTGSGADIKSAIDNAIIAMRERDFDGAGRIEVSPAVYVVLKNVLTDLSTNNPEYIKTGKVGNYDGFEVIETNTLATDSTYVYCDIRSKDAIAFVGQLQKVEALRDKDNFKDYVRGLDVYGGKVISPAEIQVIRVPKATLSA